MISNPAYHDWILIQEIPVLISAILNIELATHAKLHVSRWMMIISVTYHHYQSDHYSPGIYSVFFEFFGVRNGISCVSLLCFRPSFINNRPKQGIIVNELHLF